MFHNILVAVDGSPDAEQALTEAIDLAESEHTRLTLFTAVSQLPSTAYLAAGEEVGKLVEDAHADAEAILRRARERVPDGLSVTAVLSEQPIRAALIGQIANGVLRPRRDGLARPRRRSGCAAREHQSLRPAPQPCSGAHRARRSFEGAKLPALAASPSDGRHPRRRRVLLAAQGGVGGCVRGRRLVHGPRARRPDPAGDREEPARLAEPGRASVHELLRLHRHLDARLERRRQPDRRQAHAARRPRPDHRLQRGRGCVEQHRCDRRTARRLGARERALHRHGPVGDRRLGQRRRRRRGRAVRGSARPRYLVRAAARRRARRYQLARPVLRRRGADEHRVRRDRHVPGAHTTAAEDTSECRSPSRCARSAIARRAAAD